MRGLGKYVAPLVLGLLLGAAPAAAQMGGMGGMEMGGAPPVTDDSSSDDVKPAYQGPHQMKPLSLEKFDKAVTAMFNKADLNHDGMVTLAELQQIVTQRRDQIIRSRFGEIDTNHDGTIDFAEFMAWQQDMGSAASSNCSAYAGQSEIVPESVGPDLGSSEQDEALAIAIEPLTALTITKANVHYRPGLTLDDLLAYENARFNAADTNHDTYLEQDEVLAMRHVPKPQGHEMGVDRVNWKQSVAMPEPPGGNR